MDKSTVTTFIDFSEYEVQKDILIKLSDSISSDAYSRYQKQLEIMTQLVIDAEKYVKYAEKICYPKAKLKYTLKTLHGFRYFRRQDN